MKKYWKKLFSAVTALLLLAPMAVWAAGEKATALIVVADTRRISSGIERYFADLYNTDTLMFAIWCVVLTAVYGAVLGVIMDFLMARTGLDLTSRKIVEH